MSEVARVLREARDLMNTNGRHWIKGEMSLEIDEDFIDNRDRGFYTNFAISPKAQPGDIAYCTWGGLKEVTWDDDITRVEAMEALVQIIDPDAFKNYMREMDYTREEWEDSCQLDNWYKNDYPTFEELWISSLESREEQLGDIIARWNDADKRTWSDVRTSLTKAAAKAKRK